MKTTQVSDRLRQHRFGRVVAWLLFSAFLVTGTTYAYLTDTGNHLPPTTGTFAYNTFTPNLAGFPAVGGTYTDPVFGSVVRRLTNIGSNSNDDWNYAFHYLSATGIYSFHHSNALPNVNVISTSNGSMVYSNRPDGDSRDDVRWDMLDDDKYYYLSGNNLMRHNLAANNDTVMKIFPLQLQTQGGSANFQSANGRYFVVKYNNTHHIWDSQGWQTGNDTIYSGNITGPPSAGYIGITPDGALAFGGGYSGSVNGDTFRSFAIDHINKSVNMTGVNFWNLCGDHGAVVSATDGRNYLTTFNCSDATQVYAVEMHVDRSAMTVAQQKAAGLLLFNMVPPFNDGGHMTGVSVGTNQNWVFIGIESNDDNFNVVPTAGNWRPFKQEIVAANVLTGELRRLAHHRSRSRSGSIDYQSQPKVSSSPTGNVVLWSSNFNINSPSEYADLYAIQSPLGPVSGQIPAPQNLRFK